jgi:hypothetical protein
MQVLTAPVDCSTGFAQDDGSEINNESGWNNARAAHPDLL